MKLLALVALAVVLGGCTVSRAPVSSPPPASSMAPMVDAYALSTNTAADVEAAKAAVEASLNVGLAPDIKPSMLVRGPRAVEEVPLDWFATHSTKPYKVVALVAQSQEDRKRIAVWRHLFVVVRPTPTTPWVVWSADEGV